MRTLISFLILLLICAAHAEKKDCTGRADNFLCHFDTVSWVEVSLQGDLESLKQYKAHFERLVRRRLRNGLSMIGHETNKMGDFENANLDAGLSYEEIMEALKSRAQVNCNVWTVGDNDFPVAFHVECELWAWGYGDSYKGIPTPRSFEDSVLGYAHANKTKDQVDASLRDVIAGISAKLLEQRDGTEAFVKRVRETDLTYQTDQAGHRAIEEYSKK